MKCPVMKVAVRHGLTHAMSQAHTRKWIDVISCARSCDAGSTRRHRPGRSSPDALSLPCTCGQGTAVRTEDRDVRVCWTATEASTSGCTCVRSDARQVTPQLQAHIFLDKPFKRLERFLFSSKPCRHLRRLPAPLSLEGLQRGSPPRQIEGQAHAPGSSPRTWCKSASS